MREFIAQTMWQIKKLIWLEICLLATFLFKLILNCREESRLLGCMRNLGDLVITQQFDSMYLDCGSNLNFISSQSKSTTLTQTLAQTLAQTKIQIIIIIMDSIEHRRKNKELIRKSIKKGLKFPRVFDLKKCTDKTINILQKPMKLDRRYFHNIFKLNEKLGQGASGYVYKCTEIKTGHTYAVKILEGDEEFVRIVKQTYQIMKLFDDETILRGKCCFIDQNTQQIYLVMEYCEFPSLAKIVQDKVLSDQDIKILISKLLSSVNTLHEASVCHRDIKPQNILYDTKQNKIKIIDFGVSKAMYNRRTGEKESMWTVTGSQYYKAPEMLNGSAYDQKVDVWAIGIIAYQLMFGRLPFYSEYASQVIDCIISQQPDFNNQKVTALDIDFLKALLRKDPKIRLSCSEALRHPWIQIPRRYKKSDDLSSSQNIFMKYQICNRKLSPSISTLLVNPNTLNVNDFDLDMDNGIIEVHKDLDMDNWISLRHRSSSKMCVNSEAGSSYENSAATQYQISIVGLDE